MMRTIACLLTLAALSVAPRNGPAREPAMDPAPPLVLAHEAKVLLPTLVFLPPEFDPEREHTLILGFHGYGASARGFERTARALAGMGFLVALPESAYPLVANGELGFQWFPRMEGDEDGQRIAQLLFFDHMPGVLLLPGGRVRGHGPHVRRWPLGAQGSARGRGGLDPAVGAAAEGDRCGARERGDEQVQVRRPATAPFSPRTHP